LKVDNYCLLTKLLKFADEFDMLPDSGTVLVCVSGGADSMCLLDALLSVAGERGFTVASAHYNHRLRGAESERDEEFVREFCQKRGVPFYCGVGDVRAYAEDMGLGIEEAARDMRYEFFQKTARDTDALRIATAHTMDDNAETVIMNLTRGAGARGLSGIPPVRGNIVRPMLGVSRDECLQYIAERGLEYVEESSNSLEFYTRNKIRRIVMPVLKESNPRVCEAMAASAALFRSDEEFLTETADGFIKDYCDGSAADAAALLALHPAVSARVVRSLYGGNLSHRHVSAVLELCGGDNPSVRLSLPGMTVYREYNKLVFGGDSCADGFAPVYLTDGFCAEIEGIGLKISCKETVCDDRINKSLTSFLFKCDDLYGKISVRPRADGDLIKLPGGTKSLKKLFIERRVPRRLRPVTPVIADESGVLAVYGIAQGQRAVPEAAGARALEIKFRGRSDILNWAEHDFENILFSEETIKKRVEQLGAEIARDYSELSLMLIGILKGSFIFLADLVRSIDLDCEIRFISASSYGTGSVSTGAVNIDKILDFEVAGRDILLIEDILDSGMTMTALKDFLTGLNPASLKICALLDKAERRKVPVAADYTGFECPDEFIVGYGLDFAERYRNLPYIVSLKPEIYSS